MLSQKHACVGLNIGPLPPQPERNLRQEFHKGNTGYHHPTSTKEVMFLARFVSLSDSKQDCTKTTGLIFMKLGGKVHHGPRKNPKFFGVAPSHVAARRINFHFR